MWRRRELVWLSLTTGDINLEINKWSYPFQNTRIHGCFQTLTSISGVQLLLPLSSSVLVLLLLWLAVGNQSIQSIWGKLSPPRGLDTETQIMKWASSSSSSSSSSLLVTDNARNTFQLWSLLPSIDNKCVLQQFSVVFNVLFPCSSWGRGYVEINNYLIRILGKYRGKCRAVPLILNLRCLKLIRVRKPGIQIRLKLCRCDSFLIH